MEHMFIEDGFFPCPYCARYAPIIDLLDSMRPNGEGIVFSYVNTSVSDSDIARTAYEALTGKPQMVIPVPVYVNHGFALYFSNTPIEIVLDSLL